MSSSLLGPLQVFAATVTEKMSQITSGAPEDQLRAPLENLLSDVALRWQLEISCVGETQLPDRLGRPDYAIHLNQLLTGYIELKPSGTGANAKRFRGRNREQFERFKAVPNLLYTDGNEWALYRSGELTGRIVQISGDVSTDGKKAVSQKDGRGIENILRDFLTWKPFLPRNREGKIDLRAFAEMLAPLCRMLRKDVEEALEFPRSPLVQLKKDWRKLLFPEASDEQFSDSYAQTVLFALLLGRSVGAEPLTPDTAASKLATQHGLLSRALTVLTETGVQAAIDSSLNLLLRVIAVVPPTSFSESIDPWLYFYEDFLSVYDRKLQKEAGVYYTPVEVVRAQVGLVGDLLCEKLGKLLGFADPTVVTLDPATGTGTYLLGVIEHALGHVEQVQGQGAIEGAATTLADRLHGFETLVGPYAVSELRVSNALLDQGAKLPKGGPHIYLTDTLESPYSDPPQSPLFHSVIAEQHRRALNVKSNIPVIVCLGNPPYRRHDAATSLNKAITGGWIRWGDEGQHAKLQDFIEPVKRADYGSDLKNLYNLYIYFWRWALWKVIEEGDGSGPGIVSFITASSYLEGNAFIGMREHMRRHCDEIWILDLGGDGRGPRREENVFPTVRTPVAIAVALRVCKSSTDVPAKVHYARIRGTRSEKLKKLCKIDGISTIEWQKCSDAWHSPFRPVGEGGFFSWPLLTDLMPWQHSGVQLKRTWPIAPDTETQKRRWISLLSTEGEGRVNAFRYTGDRDIHRTYNVKLTHNGDSTPIARLPKNTPMPVTQRYAYRSFDRQYIIADNRLISRPRPALWHAHSDRQVYLTSLFTQPLGCGPALTSSALIPDLHHFSGRGAKDVLPLYRTPDALQMNILPGLLELLSSTYKRAVTPEDFLAYVYGTLAQREFTTRFSEELESCDLRVPITRDVALFEDVCSVGAHLLWLHTYGERFVPEGKPRGQIPPGAARNTVAVSGTADGYPKTFAYNDETATLHVGGGEFSPVSPELFAFEVSGLKVVQSWLSYRMKEGKKLSRKDTRTPLDFIRPQVWTSQFTTELLELLWVLEATLELYSKQADLLQTVVARDCFNAIELPLVPEIMRNEPSKQSTNTSLFNHTVPN